MDGSSSDKDPRRASAAPKSSEANPFIAFRRYADAHVSSLLRSLGDFPSSLSTSAQQTPRKDVKDDLSPRHAAVPDWVTSQTTEETWEERRAREEREPGQRTAIPVQTCRQRKPSDEGPFFLGTSGGDTSGALQVDMPFFAGRALAWPILDHFPFHGTATAWPVGYILGSPYSPIHLEQTGPRQAMPSWRAAFEDLLHASEGQEMPSRETGQDTLSDGEEHPDVWVMRLLERGPRVRTGPSNNLQASDRANIMDLIVKTCGGEDVDDTSNGAPATELDLYTHFLGSASPPTVSPASPPSAMTRTDPPDAREDDKPTNVLSTLTTTERTTAPDGTVQTKVVLKKRFADGHEESSETVHTQQRQGQQPRRLEHQPPTSDGQTRKSGGWFWSS